MQRQIFVVSASIVDANGAYANLSGYPKTFDSHLYGDDIDKAQRRAIGDASEVFGTMCKRDDRQLQTVMVMTADGFVIKKESIGKIADLPDPEPEPVEKTNEPE